MPEEIDSRGTHMSVRPMTEMESKRWPDADIAFTIHYAEGAVKAHALVKIEDAYTFARTIIKACEEAGLIRANRGTLRDLARYREESGKEG